MSFSLFGVTSIDARSPGKREGETGVLILGRGMQHLKYRSPPSLENDQTVIHSAKCTGTP
jgi:hypothetical protein